MLKNTRGIPVIIATCAVSVLLASCGSSDNKSASSSTSTTSSTSAAASPTASTTKSADVSGAAAVDSSPEAKAFCGRVNEAKKANMKEIMAASAKDPALAEPKNDEQAKKALAVIGKVYPTITDNPPASASAIMSSALKKHEALAASTPAKAFYDEWAGDAPKIVDELMAADKWLFKNCQVAMFYTPKVIAQTGNANASGDAKAYCDQLKKAKGDLLASMLDAQTEPNAASKADKTVAGFRKLYETVSANPPAAVKDAVTEAVSASRKQEEGKTPAEITKLREASMVPAEWNKLDTWALETCGSKVIGGKK